VPRSSRFSAPGVAIAGALAVGVACAPARGPSAAAPALSVSHLQAPPGVTLVDACTPTGPELCFNAVDDNCNGVIDEGCGEATGLLQFTVAWAASAPDVNLFVTTPGGEKVPGEHGPSSQSGCHLDHDCRGTTHDGDPCHGQNEENVSCDGLDPPHGHYVVDVVLADINGGDAPVKVRFGARLGARVVGFDVDLAPGDDASRKKTFSFDVP
jgi:hypothetical protein